MTKTIKGWTLIADKKKCPPHCTPLGDFCSYHVHFFTTTEKDAAENACSRVPGCEAAVPATLTYEVPE